MSAAEMLTMCLYCALAATQCIVIGPVCGWVGLLPRWLKIACIDSHQTGLVGKGSDHLKLIKFRPSHTQGKGVCGGVKFFGLALLQPAHSVCISSEHFFHLIMW